MVDTQLLSSLATTPAEHTIDPEILGPILSNPPFISLPGSMNVRDIGAYSPGYVKPGIIFRSGTLDYLPESSRPLLRSQLGLRKIFDFRRRDEVKKPLCEVDGIQILSFPFKDGQVEDVPLDLADFVSQHGELSSKGFREMYDLILEGYTTGYREVFEALKTVHDGNAVLFHCAGGKDRTGVMSALILDLMGAPASVIAEEYALTRIGVEPLRETMLPVVVLELSGVVQADHEDAAAAVQRGLQVPGVRGVLSSDAGVMVDFVERLKENHGGAEGYLTNKLGFVEADIMQIRDNLRP
ncbi:hypothetical protein QQS21_002826 [Conoideocrella luteorostrata]|uniref:Tyrosine specific protein phosphatases domain-containing protein n=1 Tax=Conoideocrella luteorostrata TaxID=1105319 RepID=A0AAJ0G0X3_9HYPO|nr:hypothetical protein QQS21_002826 [Conoideocrella luteorostrata]